MHLVFQQCGMKKTLNSDSHSSVIKKLTIREQFTIWPHSACRENKKIKRKTWIRQQTDNKQNEKCSWNPHI